MFGFGTEIEAVNARYRSREMYRDAYVYVGMFVFFLVGGGGMVLLNVYQIPLNFWLVMAVSAVIGIICGYLAYRRGVNITARLREEDRILRQADKKKQIEAMLRQQNKAD